MKVASRNLTQMKSKLTSRQIMKNKNGKISISSLKWNLKKKQNRPKKRHRIRKRKKK